MHRNLVLDYFKLLLSFMVVAIHNPIFKEVKMVTYLLTNGLSRVAVPCFFIINGLYISKVINSLDYLKVYIKRLFILYLVWMFIYSPFYLFEYKDTLVKSVILSIASLLTGYWHLWYIVGLIGAVLVLFFLKKRGFSDLKLFVFSLVLYLVGWFFSVLQLVFHNYPGLIGSIIRSGIFSRNFLFMGFPFVTFGYLISQKDSLKKIKNILSKHYLFYVLISLYFVEVILYYFKADAQAFELYLGLIFICPILVMKILSRTKKIRVDNDFVSKLSSAIYFIHPLVFFLVKKIFIDFNNNQHYILIILFSMIFGSSLIYINKSIKIFF